MLTQVKPPTKKVVSAVLASFPSEREHPGRWIRLDDVESRMARPRVASSYEVKDALIWLQRGPKAQLDWQSFGGWFYARPIKGALPFVTAHQLPYLEQVWDMLTNEWVEIGSKEFAGAASTDGGMCYLGHFCKKGIIEKGYEKRPNGSLDFSHAFLRRGKSRIVVFPRAWPANGEHLVLPALTATP
jgi:hypothetical protein